MYVPPHFTEDRIPVLHEMIRDARLASLVTVGAEGPIASHVPLLLDASPAPFGTLRGHLAKANPQWRDTVAGAPALAIFMGPDAYVSPSWYETKRQTGRVVPTWNYTAIHAYGRLRFFEDREPLLAIVTALTERHESRRAAPWAVSDAPPDFITAHLKGIVGFELTLTRLEGKWKMSQNRPEADRVGTIAGLREEGGVPEHAVADIMAKL